MSARTRKTKAILNALRSWKWLQTFKRAKGEAA